MCDSVLDGGVMLDKTKYFGQCARDCVCDYVCAQLWYVGHEIVVYVTVCVSVCVTVVCSTVVCWTRNCGMFDNVCVVV